MKNYQVVTCQFLQDLEERVNELLSKGWVPTGGIYVKTIGQMYCQAMWHQDRVTNKNVITGPRR